MKKALAALLIAALTLMGCALAEEAAVPELIEPVGVRLDTAKVVRQDIYGRRQDRYGDCLNRRCR